MSPEISNPGLASRGNSVAQVAPSGIRCSFQQALYPQSVEVAIKRTTIGTGLKFGRLIGGQKCFDFCKNQEHRQFGQWESQKTRSGNDPKVFLRKTLFRTHASV